MSADGSVTLFFGDDDYVFRIGIGEFREVQEKVNRRRVEMGLNPVGPTTLANLLRNNDAWPDDARDILRIGLVGGGMELSKAARMMVNYFDKTPPIQSYLTAFTVLTVAFIGVGGDEVDVKKKTKTTDPTSPSSSPTSTAAALS